jgi:hypothetical protein
MVTPAEIIPRPIMDGDVLAIETSRMLPLQTEQITLFEGMLSGHSKERLLAENPAVPHERALYTSAHGVLRCMDARTWTEATRVAVELGLVAIIRSARRWPTPHTEQAELYTDSSQGMRFTDISVLRGLSAQDVKERHEDLMDFMHVPPDAYTPQAAAAYRWYMRTYAAAPLDVLERKAILGKRMHVRAFLHGLYPEAGFGNLPDTQVAQCIQPLDVLLKEVVYKPTHRRYERIQRFLHEGLSWEHIRSREGLGDRAISRMLCQVRHDVGREVSATDFIALAGLDTRLPIPQVPPLARGVVCREPMPFAHRSRQLQDVM